MKRKHIYGLLFTPIFLFVLALIALPTFRTEFVHNVRQMMGLPAPDYGDGKTLTPEEKDDMQYSESGVPIEEEAPEGAGTGGDETDEGDEDEKNGEESAGEDSAGEEGSEASHSSEDTDETQG